MAAGDKSQPTPGSAGASAGAPTPAPAKKTPAASSPAGGTQYTATTWAQALLQRLGAPASATNVQAIVAWEASEGGHWNNTAWYNPLNSTLTMSGSSVMSGGGAGASAHVQAYTSWDEGLDATVRLLNQSNMSSIKTALMTGTDAGAVANAVVNHSPWGTTSIDLNGDHSTYGTTAVNPKSSGTYTSTASTIDPTATAQLSESNFEAGLDAAGFPKLLLDSIPQLKTIFDNAVQQKWWLSDAGINKFLTAIQNTDWWKKTDASNRSYQTLKIKDPSTYQTDLTNKIADVRLAATSMGVQLSAQDLTGLATRAMTMGLDDNDVSALLASHIKFAENAKYTGQVGLDASSIQAMASDYGVRIGDSQTTDLLQKMAIGQLSPATLTDYFKQLAVSKYPNLTKQLNSGLNVSNIADPYKQSMNQILEVNPDTITNDDPTVQKALQQPDGQGGFQTMPLYQFNNMLRQDPRWLKTTNAKSTLMDTTTQVLKNMGLVAVG